MFKRTLFLLSSPRYWLIAAALCLGGWVVLGYHQDQVAAQLLLEQKAGIEASKSAAGPDLSGFRQLAFAMMVGLVLVAAFLQIRTLRGQRTSSSSRHMVVPPSTEVPTAFQPIKTQEELVGEDETEQEDIGLERRPTRMVSQFAQSAIWSKRPTKSRR